jgi:hypothetical protein
MAANLHRELSLDVHEASRNEVDFATGGYQVAYKAGLITVIVTFGSCDGRMVLVVVGGHGARETSDHMIASFRCHSGTP